MTQFPGSPAVHVMLQSVPQPSPLHSSPVPSVHPSSLCRALLQELPAFYSHLWTMPGAWDGRVPHRAREPFASFQKVLWIF